MSSAQQEIRSGDRFAFGANWQEFLRSLDEDRIQIAEQSLKKLLATESLQDQTFLDAGSGSGLFSLCARRLGASVHSFDFDPQSVACTQELKARYFPADPDWQIESGSVLDRDFLNSLGTFHVVYSWGVLHHTGAMWSALENVASLCQPHGKLVIAIYNDQGWLSRFWWWVKKTYCSGQAGRRAILLIFVPYFFLRTVVVSLIRRRNEFKTYRRHRGMSIYHDWIDWLGGFPFEVATVEEIKTFYEARGFQLEQLKATKRLGCNEFVFARLPTNRTEGMLNDSES